MRNSTMGEKKYAANHLDRQTHCQCVTCLSVLIQVATPSLCSTNELWQAQFLEKRSLNDFFFFFDCSYHCTIAL